MAGLTGLQTQTLGLVRDGKVIERNCGTSAWRIWGASPQAIGKLGSLGLISKTKVDERSYRFDLTEAGLKALEG